MRLNKKFLIFIGIAIFCGIVLYYLSRTAKDNTSVSTETSSSTPRPIAENPKDIPSSPQIESNGITINNVYKNSVKVTPETDVLVSDETGYQIMYLQKFDQFLISILNPDFESGRKAAEEKLLQQTGTNRETSCKLKVVISTPNFVNSQMAGKTFGLSFCESK